MEHEGKTMLTQKIRAAENNPVTWNKEMVWTNVRERVKTKPNYRYYIAAAVIVLFVLVGTLLRETATPDGLAHRQTQPTQTDVAIGEAPEETKEPTSEQTEHVSSNRPAMSYTITSKPEHAGDPIREPDRESANEPSDVEIDVDLAIHEPSLPSDPLVRETIQPIVGVVGWSDKDVVTKKVNKKRLLRRLDSPDPESTDDTSKPILFARIK